MKLPALLLVSALGVLAAATACHKTEKEAEGSAKGEAAAPDAPSPVRVAPIGAWRDCGELGGIAIAERDSEGVKG